MKQYELICLDELVGKNHNYRKFLDIWSFKFADKKLKKLEKDNPHKGYGLPILFRCLILQFMEDLSDRELEKVLEEKLSAKLFVGFALTDNIPD